MLFIFWFIYFGPVFAYKFWVLVVLAIGTSTLASLPLNHFLGQYLASGDCRPPPKEDSVPLFQGTWLSLIKAELGPACDVALTKIGSVSIAENGARKEQWFVRTSLGNFEYRVDYYPSNSYPERSTPFEISKVAGSLS
jgi:hypothetical protein